MEDSVDDPWALTQSSLHSDPWAVNVSDVDVLSNDDDARVILDAFGMEVRFGATGVDPVHHLSEPAQQLAAFVEPLPLLPQAVVPAAPAAEAAAHITPSVLMNPFVGRQVHCLVASAFRENVRVTKKVLSAVEHYLGDIPRGAGSLAAERRILQWSRRDIAELPQDLGMIAHLAVRSFVGTVCTHILNLIDDQKVKLIACGTSSTYDETPLKFQVDCDTQNPRRFDEVPAIEGPPGEQAEPEAKRRKMVAQTCKVLQSDHKVMILLEINGNLCAIYVPLAPPLQSADSVTGEVTAKFLKEQLEIPSFAMLRSKAKFPFDVASCDRAGSNLRAEHALASESLANHRLTLACILHMAHTVQGRQYDPIQNFISGLLAFAVAQRAAGASEEFRTALVYVLSKRVAPVRAAPPPLDDPRSLHRHRVLELFLSGSPQAKQRLAVLRMLLNGDIMQKTIHWHTAAEHPDVQQWATRVADLMYPHLTPLFPRSRWLRSHEAMNELGLLTACHSLFQQAVPVWIRLLKGKSPEPQGDEDAEVQLDAMVEIDIDETNQRSFVSGGVVDWSAYNEAQRGNTLKLSQQNPGPTAVVARIALSPMVTLCQQLLDRSSAEWEARTFRAASKGEQLKLRIVEVHNGVLTLPPFASVGRLLTESTEWLALEAGHRTANFQALAFSMLSRAATALHQLMHHTHQGYPFRLWRLVGGDRAEAEAIKMDPQYLMDEWTQAFLNTWPEVEDLVGAESRGLLTFLGALAPLDIGSIECRHSTIRRIMRASVQTHVVPLVRASSNFVLLR